MTNYSDFINDVNFWPQLITDLDNLVISDIGATTLAMASTVEFGTKQVYSGFIGLQDSEVSTYLKLKFGEKWDSLINTTLLDLGVDSEKLITTTTDLDQTDSNDNTTINKITAMNTVNMVDNDSSVNTGTGSKNVDTVVTSTEKNINYASMIEHLNTASKVNIMTVLVKDVATALTLIVSEY